LKKNFLSKIAIYLSLGLHKGPPNCRRSLQPSKENIQQWASTSKYEMYYLFYIFLGHFCPPGSGSGLRSRAPCESGSNLDPDPQHVGTRIILSVPVGIRKVFLDHHKDVNTPYTRKRRGDITLHKISVDLPWHCISPSPCPVGVSQIPAPHNAHIDPLFPLAVCASYAAYHSQIITNNLNGMIQISVVNPQWFQFETESWSEFCKKGKKPT